MAKGFQMFFPMVRHSVFARFNLEVKTIKTPVLVKSICFRQKQACVVIRKKTFHLRNDTMLLPPFADVCLQCFFKLERQSYISVTSPPNYSIIFSLIAAFLLVPLPLKCFYLASVKEIIVKISLLMQT